MKASEVIEELQSLIDEFGDKEVRMQVEEGLSAYLNTEYLPVNGVQDDLDYFYFEY